MNRQRKPATIKTTAAPQSYGTKAIDAKDLKLDQLKVDFSRPFTKPGFGDNIEYPSVTYQGGLLKLVLRNVPVIMALRENVFHEKSKWDLAVKLEGDAIQASNMMSVDDLQYIPGLAQIHEQKVIKSNFFGEKCFQLRVDPSMATVKLLDGTMGKVTDIIPGTHVDILVQGILWHMPHGTETDPSPKVGWTWKARQFKVIERPVGEFTEFQL